jgi:hypothetical protein
MFKLRREVTKTTTTTYVSQGAEGLCFPEMGGRVSGATLAFGVGLSPRDLEEGLGSLS